MMFLGRNVNDVPGKLESIFKIQFLSFFSKGLKSMQTRLYFNPDAFLRTALRRFRRRDYLILFDRRVPYFFLPASFSTRFSACERKTNTSPSTVKNASRYCREGMPVRSDIALETEIFKFS